MNRETSRQLADWLESSEKPVTFTGAGISTESGIPDFRSPGGIWSKYRTVYFDEFMNSADARYEYWRQKSEGHREFDSAEPNVGHQVLASWDRQEKLRGVITQNIDGLHQLAGNQHVLELHGTARQIACMDCGARFEAGPLVAQFLAADQVPTCSEGVDCRWKHASLSFGQSLPEETLHHEATWCEETELLFAIGSSLVVTPAAELPAIAQQNGARLVIINRDPTPLDNIADMVLRTGIGEALSLIDACC